MIPRRRAVCFDDVLLMPQYSEIMSRSEADLSCELGDGLNFQLPVISSPMDTVTEVDMALAVSKVGGLGVLAGLWGPGGLAGFRFKNITKMMLL